MDGAKTSGPVHPSGAAPAKKIEGGGSASTGAHQLRSEYINSVGASALKTDPARAIIAMAVAAGRYTLDSFSAPTAASNIDQSSLSSTQSTEKRREELKSLILHLASLAGVKTPAGQHPTQSPSDPASAHPGRAVSPHRVAAVSLVRRDRPKNVITSSNGSVATSQLAAPNASSALRHAPNTAATGTGGRRKRTRIPDTGSPSPSNTHATSSHAGNPQPDGAAGSGTKFKKAKRRSRTPGPRLG